MNEGGGKSGKRTARQQAGAPEREIEREREEREERGERGGRGGVRESATEKERAREKQGK